METSRPHFNTIDEYIATFPAEVQKTLQALRQTIHKAAPQATEKTSYQMPTFYLQGNLVHFAAYQHHIGFYPAPSGIEQFAQDLSRYEGSKGAIRFPIDQPLPMDLITRIVKFRVAENQARQQKKTARKK
jgi:uncharacterized protein YdhG (YjbR/CyaY superfamily)